MDVITGNTRIVIRQFNGQLPVRQMNTSTGDAYSRHLLPLIKAPFSSLNVTTYPHWNLKVSPETLCGLKWIIPRKCRRFVTGVFSLCVILAAQSSSQSEWEIHTVLPETSQNFNAVQSRNFLAEPIYSFENAEQVAAVGWSQVTAPSIMQASLKQLQIHFFSWKSKIIERMACLGYGRDGLTCFPCGKKSELNPRHPKFNSPPIDGTRCAA